MKKTGEETRYQCSYCRQRYSKREQKRIQKMEEEDTRTTTMKTRKCSRSFPRQRTTQMTKARQKWMTTCPQAHLKKTKVEK